MTEYFELLAEGGWGPILIIALVVLVFAGIVVRTLMGRRRQTRDIDETEVKTEQPPEAIKKSVLGTGKFKCMAIRSGNVVDFTTIPKPIGEIYLADTSCPMSGAIFIVRELENGEVVDYDPREVPVLIDQTPEHAWFATHWDIVSRVFSVPLRWWQSTSTWFAAAVLVILFISALVSLGG